MGPNYERVVVFLFLSLLLTFFSGCGGTPVTHTLTVDIEPAGGGTVSPSSGSFQEGIITLEVTPAQDFEFLEWSGTHGSEVVQDGAEWKLNMNGHKTITAIFINVTLDNLDQVTKPVWDDNKVTWDDVDNAVNYEVKLFKDGDQIETKVVSPGVEEFDFSSIIENEGSGEYTATVQALGDGTNFNHGPVSETSDPLVKFSLTVEVEGAGTVEPSEGIFSEGIITLVVTPAEDYIFDDWAGDHGNEVYEEGNEWKLMIDGNKSITAVFAESTLDQLDQVGKPIWVGDVITWDDVDNAVNYNVHFHKDGTYLENRIVAPGIEEYDFSSVMEAQGSGAYTVRIQALADGVNYRHAPISDFSEPLEKVTLTIGIGKGLGETDPEPGTYLYNKDEVIDITATPDADLKWEFGGWKGSVEDFTQPATNVTMDSDQKVLAVFSGGFAGGSGTEEDPFEVEDGDQLNNVRGYIDLCFIQTEDISLSKFRPGEGWEPIINFKGTYDGSSKEITDLKIDRPGDTKVGLFGNIIENATIKNVKIIDAEITGYSQVGLLVGHTHSSEIFNCHVTGVVSGVNTVGGLVGGSVWGLVQFSSSRDGIVEGLTDVGGLIGHNYISTIRRSYSIIEVKGTGFNIGGLVGLNIGYDTGSSVAPSLIEVSSASGKVSGSGGENVGGLVGKNSDYGQIKNCYAIGTTEGKTNVGGLVGLNEGSDTDLVSLVEKSYSIGEVQGTSYVGGLVGKQNGTAITEKSYWDRESSGRNTSAAGASRTTKQMQEGTPDQEVDGVLIYEGWNTDDEIWNFGTEEDYPIFTSFLFPIPPIIIFP